MNLMNVIEMLSNGAVLADAEDSMSKVLEAVYATGKKGTLTIKLDVKSVGYQKVDVTPTIKADIPRPTRNAETLFVDDEMQLSTRDPNQPSIPGMGDEEEDVDRVVNMKTETA